MALYDVSLTGGEDGKSAYQYAVDAGYEGTEEEFAQLLLNENTEAEKIVYNNSVSGLSANNVQGAIDELKDTVEIKVANLVGTAPETLDTLEEVAQAIEENEDVVTALNSAIGSKANQSDLDTLQGVVDTKVSQDDLNGYMLSENPTGTGTLSMNRKEDTTIGNYSTALGVNATASAYASHAEGGYTTTSGSYSHAEGGYTTASGSNSHAEGGNTEASGSYSHAEGGYTTASGSNSHAEGNSTEAIGQASHAEGYYTESQGNYSHSEGKKSIASGEASHAEGYETTASECSSHSEGYGTVASGVQSHVEGYYTIAKGENQHVQGKWNVEDTNNTYAHIVGGGTSNERKNIHTLDWDGNAYFSGDVTATDSEGNTVSLLELSSASGSSDMNEYLPLSGGTMTGQLNFGSTSYSIGSSGCGTLKQLTINGTGFCDLTVGTNSSACFAGDVLLTGTDVKFIMRPGLFSSYNASDGSPYYFDSNANARVNVLKYTSSSAYSSQRYKDNINYKDTEYWHNALMDMKPCTFSYKNDENSTERIGLIAEDLYELIPELVILDDEDKPSAIEYANLVVPLIAEVQRLNSIIDTQQATINNLLEKFDELEQKIK